MGWHGMEAQTGKKKKSNSGSTITGHFHLGIRSNFCTRKARFGKFKTPLAVAFLDETKALPPLPCRPKGDHPHPLFDWTKPAKLTVLQKKSQKCFYIRFKNSIFFVG